MASQQRFPSWVRHAGVGLELAGAIGGFAFAGYWVDRYFGTNPWGILGGVVLGLVGGLYNLIKESLAAVREAKVEDTLARNDAPRPPE
jgi:F0F1-type ATP synthase assembly protein I